MDKNKKPRPRITPDNKRFWDACRTHELHLPYCPSCDSLFMPPSPVCPHCLNMELRWRQVSGRGRVSTFVEVHQKWFEAFTDDLPYNVAQIQLEEGPRLTANLVGVANADIRVGMPVRVVFDDIDEQLTLPRFCPV
ncbi:MAG: hypothetical protein CMM47_04130 [Rhodospirillaceae bacterium]|nr:hypothetical protein [Rhodospirillaceae bacterium]